MAEVEVQIALFAGAWVKGTEIHVEPTQEEMMIRGKVARDAAKQTHATSSLQGDSLMIKLIVQLMFAMVVGVAVVSFSYAADLTESPILKTIEGDLLKIDGEFYVVKNMAGKEIRLHADKTTVLDSTIKAGDKVQVQTTESSRPYKSGFVDHAVSIKHLQPTK